MATVAEQFVEVLVAAGVKDIYGIVGDSLNGLTDAVRRDKIIERVHVRHAEVAAFAAGADAHLTGSLAVCDGSCGPGILNLINGLFDCHGSRVPALAIAAQISYGEIGSGYFQETHPEALFRECRQARLAVGDLERVLRVARFGEFFNVASRFDALSQAMNRVSDLIAQVFGKRGRHARTAVGAAHLPFNALVEIEATLAIDA